MNAHWQHATDMLVIKVSVQNLEMGHNFGIFK